MKAIYIYLLLLTLLSCKESDMIYNLDKVTIVNVEQNENIVKVSYRPLMETLFFCPGVLINKTADNIEISFVRCKIKSDCPVTLKSQQGEEGVDFFSIENKGMPVFVLSEGSKKKLFPK